MPKWSQNGGKWEPKMCPKSRFQKKVPKVSSTPYLLYIITIGTLPKPHFFVPGSSHNAGLPSVVARMPPRGCKMVPTGPKNGESGVPGIPKGAKGSPNASQNVPQNHPKSAPLSRSASRGAPGVPRVPRRPQNTSIFPSRRNVPPSPPTLCYTPLTSSPANVKHPSSAAVWAYAHLD